jgi:hypothetical protein
MQVGGWLEVPAARAAAARESGVEELDAEHRRMDADERRALAERVRDTGATTEPDVHAGWSFPSRRSARVPRTIASATSASAASP